ncbi:Sugar or nucleoside kinase, ribokinase family [Paenibacillus sp. UNC496MF]|uniref:carbohydrate kinase family protein n=1 Tax=Paenibacillus sp. UNC496MF TaxID=1502753 RepID=UPI0008E4A163|nr:carbohydrate kinase family protein [Paenibacillus sp. UNC496MF]SFJ81192.1 Sugar or nucleoside kinase, ribokinase family [Paenibacillus sp. UNC496MF]
MKKFDAVVVGDVNIDLVVVGQSQVPQPGQEVFVDNMLMHVGGGAALFALSLAKLGLGVAFSGVLGADSNGSFIREQFAQYGIDTSLIETSKVHRTGISIAFNPDTDRSFLSYAGSNQELALERLELDRIAQGRHVHLTGYRGRENHATFLAVVQQLKEKGVTLSCDVGWDDSGEWYEGIFELMRHIDVFLMNETEALHYTRRVRIEDGLRHMADYGKHIVVKLGAEGAVAMKDGVLTRHPAFKVEAVDTTGAGDSFNAGYLYGFLRGLDVETSLKYGNACGAMSVGAYGGSTGTANMDGLREFLERHEAGRTLPKAISQ